MAYNMYGQQQNGWMPQQPNYQYYQNQPQQSFGMPTGQNTPIPQRPIFVDGEMAAKVFQLPDNWPIGVPLYLWDVSGDCFYMKVIGPNGVPLPVRAFEFHEKEMPSGYISSGSVPQMDPNQYVTKDAFEAKMNELKDLLRNNQSNRGQNGNNQQNRGGNQ